MAAEILRKLTIRNCGFNVAVIKEIVTEETPKADLLKIVGITTGSKAGQTDKGEYLRLLGDFRAVNMQTGEIFQSASCILPSFISDSLGEALKSSPRVEFAIMIGAEFQKDAITQYEYTVSPLIEAKPSDQMAALLSNAGANEPVRLPAPKAAKAAKAA
jgi:hypothetical protein